ncbi:MAG: PepSY domain-containing protein [Burkholderiales bacterium]|nr:PepSY domain-containing protein [Burkholderiales bacterium]
MFRRIHSVLGLAAAILLMVVAASGAVLSVLPAIDRAQVVAPPAAGASVATVAGRIASQQPGVEVIKRLPSGKVVAYFVGNDAPPTSVIDPATGAPIAAYTSSATQRWFTNLHRSLFLDDAGRVAMGLTALALLVLIVSGLVMTARRMGGWRRIFGRARGNRMQRLHVDLGRVALIGLVPSTLTALYLSLATFGFVPDGSLPVAPLPTVSITSPALPVERIAALASVDLDDLRELTFPDATQPNDLYHLMTATGEGYIDPATGSLVGWQEHAVAARVYEVVYMLHTGQGLWWLGLVLGAAVLGLPILGITGAVIWWRRRRTQVAITGNVAAARADTVLLVGSESGSTWGFARTLHAALTANGHQVHAAPMNGFTAYPAARRLLVLAATYGDGAAPTNADSFVERVEAMKTAPAYPVAVLGFGDRQFPHFCQFAADVDAALARGGWTRLLPLATIDRQSAQSFTRWGEDLAAAMGETFTVTHVPERPRTYRLRLTDRVDYGEAIDAPTAVLRFALPATSLGARLAGRSLPRFHAGDLLAVVPPGDDVPRYYSLASASADGFVEICVRKRPGGLCSGFLHGLAVGETIEAFVQSNPTYRPAPGKRPVILIGAGAGIGPLAGFIRANEERRPLHLYFGGRSSTSDFLYEREIAGWLDEGRLTTLATSFSREKGGGYVQDRVHRDAERLRALIASGAHVMVCGGREMASGVMRTLADVLAPIGVTPLALKAQGRYSEDVY